MGERWVLAIDFGTSFTSAAMVVGERMEVLEVDGAPSAALGRVVARRRAGRGCGCREPTPAPPPSRRAKPQALSRREEEPAARWSTRAGGGRRGWRARAVYAEALRRAGGEPPAEVRLTHPARWPVDRLEALRTAADVAGIPSVCLLAEPVAAAMHYGGNKVDTGEYVAVYDLGGGTFDTAVLRRTAGGFELAGPPGRRRPSRRRGLRPSVDGLRARSVDGVRCRRGVGVTRVGRSAVASRRVAGARRGAPGEGGVVPADVLHDAPAGAHRPGDAHHPPRVRSADPSRRAAHRRRVRRHRRSRRPCARRPRGPLPHRRVVANPARVAPAPRGLRRGARHLRRSEGGRGPGCRAGPSSRRRILRTAVSR